MLAIAEAAALEAWLPRAHASQKQLQRIGKKGAVGEGSFPPSADGRPAQSLSSLALLCQVSSARRSCRRTTSRALSQRASTASTLRWGRTMGTHASAVSTVASPAVGSSSTTLLATYVPQHQPLPFSRFAVAAAAADDGRDAVCRRPRRSG